MDLFTVRDSDEEENDINIDQCNCIFIELMKFKPFIKNTRGKKTTLLYRNIGIVGSDSILKSILRKKLEKAQFKDVIEIVDVSCQKFDIIVNLDSDNGILHQRNVISGGYYMTFKCKTTVLTSFPDIEWNVIRRNSEHGTGDELVVVQKRSVAINTLGAMYWTNKENKEKNIKSSSSNRGRSADHNNNNKSNGINNSLIDRERNNLENVTVNLSLAERTLGVFSDTAHTKAVLALQTHGMCILPGLFSPSTVMEWGEAAIKDMSAALDTLKERGIDLLRPGEGGPRIENFHELSMREALRCDLRNGSNSKALSALSNTAIINDSSVLSTSELPSDIGGKTDNIRHHCALLSVLNEAMNPPPVDIRDTKGNWGLWNFEGKGPEAGPPAFAVGKVGAVMALPGCADQTIHADTPHLYVHTQLPGHYINLFLTAVAAGSKAAKFEVGQTAFVLDSHKLRVSAHIMNEEGGQKMLEELLVRPHLQAGDALLFDCRILHFGLANQHTQHAEHDIQHNPQHDTQNNTQNKDKQNEENDGKQDNDKYDDDYCSSSDKQGWRPLIYVNYHQKFFYDPKNWNDKEKLFD